MPSRSVGIGQRERGRGRPDCATAQILLDDGDLDKAGALEAVQVPWQCRLVEP